MSTASLIDAWPVKIISEPIWLLSIVKVNVAFVPFVMPPPYQLSLDALTVRTVLMPALMSATVERRSVPPALANAAFKMFLNKKNPLKIYEDQIVV